MADLQRVDGPRPPLGGHGGRAVTLMLVAILLAVLKPWGGAAPTEPARPRGTPSPEPTAPPAQTAEPAPLDFRAFGANEPRPRWELWPAGYLVSFGFAMRIADEPVAVPTPTPSGPTGTADPSASPDLYEWPGTGESPLAWPHEIQIPAASSLYLLGLNRPLGFEVEIVGLGRLADDGTAVPVDVVLAPTPWPTHFTIVGIAGARGSPILGPWPPGRYRLDVLIEPGRIARSISVVIEGGAAGAAPGVSTPESSTAAPDGT